MSAILQLFMKAPEVGQVKTRLSPPLSMQQAAVVHEQLCWQLSEKLVSIPGVKTELWIAGDTSHPFFSRLSAKFDLPSFCQVEGDLGVRMFASLESGMARAERIVIVGGDCLSVDAAYVSDAITALETPASAVLGPANDGGYVLVGARQCRPGMFESVRWGTDQVLLQTLENFRRLNYGVKLLRPRWDIDTYEDLQRYAPELLVFAKNA